MILYIAEDIRIVEICFVPTVTSVFTMVMLTIDRFTCIKYPFYYEQQPMWLVHVLLSLPWFLGLAFITLIVWVPELVDMYFLITHVVAIVSLSTFNALVFKEARKHIKAISAYIVDKSREATVNSSITEETRIKNISNTSISLNGNDNSACNSKKVNQQQIHMIVIIPQKYKIMIRYIKHQKHHKTVIIS